MNYDKFVLSNCFAYTSCILIYNICKYAYNSIKVDCFIKATQIIMMMMIIIISDDRGFQNFLL